MDIRVAFVFLQVMDMLTTVIVLRLGGREPNPIIVWSISHFGFGSVIFWKLLVVAVLVIVWNVFKTWDNLLRFVTMINYFMMFVVLWNTINIYYTLRF